MLLYKLKKLPWSWHLTVASLCLAIAATGAMCILLVTNKRTSHLEKVLSEATFTYRQGNERTFDSTLSFTHQLPPRSKSDDLIKDMGRFASSAGVQIESIQVRPRETTELEYGSMEFAIAINGDYRGTKTWLSDLLSRYQALTVNTLNMRQGVRCFVRLDACSVY